jgi:thiol-disulfide isomerase/thioredoxin
MKKTLALLVLGILSQCTQTDTSIDGIWRAEVPTAIGPIPFNLSFETINDTIHVFALNADEKLELDHAYYKHDSIHITMEVFDAKIVVKVSGGQMTGHYTKKLGDLEERTGTFTAKKGDTFRFSEFEESSKHNVSGKWKSIFTEPEGVKYEAIGVFEQNGNKVKGTFLTTTGDYRFLEGNVIGDSLKLSCFDGTHIFLFNALIEDDKLVNGRFASSLLYEETWEAVKNQNATLPNPDELTFIKDGFGDFNFSFVNTKGEMVSLNDERFNDKVVLVQLLGSWCPNCMDESKFFVKWLKENPDKNVEIIGLAYEKSLDPAFAFPKIERMKKRFGMEYEVLLAGLYDKEEAQKTLPMLNKIISFPTTIYLDKNHKVRKVHTGFSGPGTGIYYEQFAAKFNAFMEKLTAE